ncbi:MAG: toast rack family protein [Gemmatimonadaceae bacterium]
MSAADRTGLRPASVAFAALLLAPLAFTATSVAGGAQSWRTLTASRQARGADSLRVRVEYGVGTLRVTKGTPSLLYEANLRYDEEKFDPVRSFDDATHTFTVGAHQRSSGSTLAAGRKNFGNLALSLAPGVPLDLTLDLGATRSVVDLSELSVRRLRIGAGASETKLTFGAPNPLAMEELSVQAGAASIVIVGLGNAHAERVRVKCNAGSVDLDLGGAWAANMELQLDIGVGAATLRLPREVGVRIRLDKVLATFERGGLLERDGSYYSGNWESATRKLTIDASTTLGALEVRWIE